jgi:hypothetical protein
MRNKTKTKKTHKKKSSKSFKKKSKKTVKKNSKNDGMMLNDDILNNPYFNIGLALSGETENNSKCDCSKNEEEILRILDEIEEKLSKFK